MSFSLSEVNLGGGRSRHWKNSKGGRQKTMTKLFRLKRQKEETWVEFQTRTSIMARKIWEQMKLPFLHEK